MGPLFHVAVHSSNASSANLAAFIIFCSPRKIFGWYLDQPQYHCTAFQERRSGRLLSDYNCFKAYLRWVGPHLSWMASEDRGSVSYAYSKDLCSCISRGSISTIVTVKVLLKCSLMNMSCIQFVWNTAAFRSVVIFPPRHLRPAKVVCDHLCWCSVC